MKKTLLLSLTFFALFISQTTFAQVPQAINYQAVAYSAPGSVASNTPVNIDVYYAYQTGTPYEALESFSETTNDHGLVGMSLGGGTFSFGDFADIDWANEEVWFRVDINNQTGAWQRFMSVPYSLHTANPSPVVGCRYTRPTEVLNVAPTIYHDMIYTDIDYDQGGNGSMYNATNGLFTCPRDGKWMVGASLAPKPMNAANWSAPDAFIVRFVDVTNSTIDMKITKHVVSSGHPEALIVEFTDVFELEKGNTYKIQYQHGFGNATKLNDGVAVQIFTATFMGN